MLHIFELSYAAHFRDLPDACQRRPSLASCDDGWHLPMTRNVESWPPLPCLAAVLQPTGAPHITVGGVPVMLADLRPVARDAVPEQSRSSPWLLPVKLRRTTESAGPTRSPPFTSPEARHGARHGAGCRSLWPHWDEPPASARPGAQPPSNLKADSEPEAWPSDYKSELLTERHTDTQTGGRIPILSHPSHCMMTRTGDTGSTVTWTQWSRLGFQGSRLFDLSAPAFGSE